MDHTSLNVIFYSMYGHTYKMAEAIVKGAKQVSDVDVKLYQVPELVPATILEKSGANVARKVFSHVPLITVDEMIKPDAFIFGTPTRFGNMCAQMRNFIDQLGGLWAKNAFVGKIGSAFTSTGTQHGGQETTLTSFHTTLFHLGMIVIGVPYIEARIMNMDEITGGTPYGASALAGGDGKREPSTNELAIAEFQGKYVAEIARDLKRGRQRE